MNSCPPYRYLLSTLILGALLFGTTALADEVAKAEPKAGRTVTPPLSARVPKAISELPRFGAITWKTTQLPWVGEGPDEGISGTGMVEIDGKIYVVGGFIPGGDEVKDDPSYRTSRWTWRFDPATDEWARMADAPIRREYVRAVAANGKLFLAGGGCQYKGQSPPYRAHGETAVFDPAAGPKGAWRLLPDLNVARTHMQVGHAGGLVVIAGGNAYDFAEKGYSHQTIRGTTEALDPAKPDAGWKVKSPIPGAPRGWCASMPINGALYLFGGITWDEANNVVPTEETLRYDPASDTWTQKTAPPVPVSGWEGALYQNRYAINIGGVVRTSPRHLDELDELVWSDLCLAYDSQDDRWMRVDGALPPGAVFNDAGVVIIGDTIYVLGAEGPYGSHYDYFLIGTISPAK